MALPPTPGMLPNGAVAALKRQASMGNPPMGASPMAVPTGNPGQQAQAATQVREAVRILEMALPSMPVGSDEHKSVLDAIKAISKNFPASESVPGIQSSTLLDMQTKAKQQAPLAALMRQAGSMSSPTGPVGAPGGAPGQPGPAPGSPPMPPSPGAGDMGDM